MANKNYMVYCSDDYTDMLDEPYLYKTYPTREEARKALIELAPAANALGYSLYIKEVSA